MHLLYRSRASFSFLKARKRCFDETILRSLKNNTAASTVRPKTETPLKNDFSPAVGKKVPLFGFT